MKSKKDKTNDIKIKVSKNGPYLVSGEIPICKQTIITDKQGYSCKWQKGKDYPNQKQCSLCRCGNSKNKPFCDGAHQEINFDGTEVASRKPYLEQAEKFEGPEMVLTDNESLCAYARFCDRAGRIWNLIYKNDPKSQEIVKQEATDCPSGRLIAWDKKMQKTFEPQLNPLIGLVEDPKLAVAGPIWVKGCIPIFSADDYIYEIRNQATLCRCGASSNKPFCDGSHVSIKFTD